MNNRNNAQPPLIRTEVSDTALYHEVLRVYGASTGNLRRVYNHGQYLNGPVEDNWIITWAIVHAFRMHDPRNAGGQGRATASGKFVSC